MRNLPLYLLTISVLILSSCTKHTLLKQYIHDADKVELMIYSDNVPQLQYAINDIDKIQLWMTYISDSTVSTSNCTFDDDLTFVQGNDSLPMHFSLKKGCTMVSYSMGGKSFVQPLTSDGIKFIQSLEAQETNVRKVGFTHLSIQATHL